MNLVIEREWSFRKTGVGATDLGMNGSLTQMSAEVTSWGATVTTEQVEEEEGENTRGRKIKNNMK